MRVLKQKLMIEQVDRRITALKVLERNVVPERGWLRSIREALRMSLRQLGEKMGMSAQSARDLELREANGTVSLRSLRQAAEALDMKLVYGFIPKGDSLEKMIEKRAEELAREIVMRTSASMKLENQENSKERLEQAIRSKAEELRNTMPNYLWNLK